MTSQPDKLFRDTLENFERPASAAAWEKIEASLDKSHNKGLWMKIAAGLLLIAVAAFILLPTSVSEKTELATTKTITLPIIEEVQKNNAVIVIAPAFIAAQKNNNPKKRSIKKEHPVLVIGIDESKNEANQLIIEPIETQAVAVEINSAEITLSRTIVYSAEEVNSKYLKKKLPGDATLEAKKTSGIQKLMGLAYNLKNTESGLGDLRQKKNEILALNFLNEDKTKKEKN